jgi:hypothetical protein
MTTFSDDELIEKCKDFTMTSRERQIQTLYSIQYIVDNNVEGDIIEIGVWKGGCVMLMLGKLLQLGITDRRVHLYDTFTGMTEPGKLDVDPHGNHASVHWDTGSCYCSYDAVYNNIQSVGYPMDLISFHVGDIRNVDVSTVPEKIAVLRLDNDWHELYKFELPIFEPKVTVNGIITIDDYGWWSGCKIAVDEYNKDKDVQYVPIANETVYWLKK